MDIQTVGLELCRLLKQMESGCMIDLNFSGGEKKGWVNFLFSAGKQLVRKGFYTWEDL